MFKVEKFLRNLIDNVLSKLLYFFVFFCRFVRCEDLKNEVQLTNSYLTVICVGFISRGIF